MSRRAVISDIHGNLVALEAVLADIQTQNVDQIVCLGDVCGYGPQPIECTDRVRASCAWTLRGNHDEALFHDPIEFGRNALTAILWQRSIMQPKPDSPAAVVERWNWLKELPAERSERDVLFVHASPRDPLYEYVLREDFDDTGLGPTQKAKDIFGAMEWLCFCGHSHRPGIVAEDYKWILPSELDHGTYVVKRGFKTIVNIGSVGQPRDGIADACYAVFDYNAPPDHTKTTQILKAGDDGVTVMQTRASARQDAANVDTPVKLPSAAGSAQASEAAQAAQTAQEEDTRFGKDLQQARDTALLNMPRVTFRRVAYDIAAAQARFRAMPELPENNWLRLAKGL